MIEHALHTASFLLLCFYATALWVVCAGSPRLRGMRVLAAGYTVALVGGSFKLMPGWETSPTADLMVSVGVIVCIVMMRYAFLRILEVRPESEAVWALTCTVVTVLLVGLNVTGHSLARTAAASGLLGVLGIMNCRLLLGRAPQALRLPARGLALVHLLYALRSLGRMAFIVATHHTPETVGALLPVVSVGASLMVYALTPLGVLWMAATSLQGELEALSSTDPLTGALNRRAFDEKGRTEMERSRRHRLPMAVVEMDVDHFKQLNDSHGHTTGDRVLQRLAEQVGQQLRTTDALARFGGDEFMLLLPVTTLEGAREMAERLREGVEQMVVEAQAERVKVRASFGVAAMAAPEENAEADPEAWETLLEQADDALYRAKKKGRNRVE